MSESEPPDVPRSPHEVYTSRRRAAQEAAALQARRAERLANLRLATFVGLVVTAWFSFGTSQLAGWWIVPPVILFAGAVVAFDRAERSAARARRLVEHYERGLANLEDRWQGRGVDGARFLDEEHIYAADLDVFGAGSLFERICRAATDAGQRTLAGWLLAPAEPEEVRARQRAVAELRDRLDLREDLAVASAAIDGKSTLADLAVWGGGPRLLPGGAARIAAAGLAAAAMGCLFGWIVLGWGSWPFVTVAGIEAVFAGFLLKRVKQVLAQLDRRTHELDTLSGVLRRLEHERFECRRLAILREAIGRGGVPASRRIAALRRLVATLDARRNMLVAPISPFLLWGTQIAMAIESWRASSGRDVARWLEAVGQVEALISLAGFAYESPEDVFPEIRDEAEPVFLAEGLAHPLLPGSQAVRNDVKLSGGAAPQVLIVSGSNMSGKSTLLRAVGAAAVLALAGGTVRAHSLAITRLQVGATLRVHDSLQAGRSRFFAEILRLRAILERAGAPGGLLFLLDEILGGTNSHDRRVGAEAIVTGLVRRGAVGLVTTHDLALAEMAERLVGLAANAHFSDRFEDGTLVFDYVMRPGVVQHSNALALMRSVGLEV